MPRCAQGGRGAREKTVVVTVGAAALSQGPCVVTQQASIRRQDTASSTWGTPEKEQRTFAQLEFDTPTMQIIRANIMRKSYRLLREQWGRVWWLEKPLRAGVHTVLSGFSATDDEETEAEKGRTRAQTHSMWQRQGWSPPYTLSSITLRVFCINTDGQTLSSPFDHRHPGHQSPMWTPRAKPRFATQKPSCLHELLLERDPCRPQLWGLRQAALLSLGSGYKPSLRPLFTAGFRQQGHPRDTGRGWAPVTALTH